MEKIKTVVCGCGHRGIWLAETISMIDAYNLLAVCDICFDKAETAQKELKEKHNQDVLIYADYLKMFEEQRPEVAVVATNWKYHVEIAIEAMKQGIAVAMEVGGAYNLEECYELVKVYEETKTPFFFLENCCFGSKELLAISLVRNGVLGEICYCSGAYGHDLREEILKGDVNRHYRLNEYITKNRENYPTHELGPIAKILNINSGNRMVSLVSSASKSRSLHNTTMQHEEYKHLRDVEFKQGDIVVTTITCENGELITLTLDTTLPRFYSREFCVRGTNGWFNENNNMVYLDGYEHMKWQSNEGYAHYTNYAEKYYDEYMPFICKNMTDEAVKAGHDGMDYLEFVCFADCFLNKKPMPIDVYDAASWMSIAYLSEISIQNNGQAVEVPDFTHGLYKTRKTIDVTDIPVVKK